MAMHQQMPMHVDALTDADALLRADRAGGSTITHRGGDHNDDVFGQIGSVSFRYTVISAVYRFNTPLWGG